MRWPWSRAADVEKAASSPGPGSFTSSAPSVPPTKPSGSDGVAITGGFIVTNENDRKLQNREKWVTYDNATLNVAIISAAINVWTQLIGSAKWTVEPNKSGSKNAERGADLIREGLIEAQLSTPWRQIVRRQAMKKFRGFALHEVVIRRRKDGKVVVADLLDRPQWSVWRWDKPDGQSDWLGVEQLTRLGEIRYVDRERLFYSVENTLSATPEGVGLLRMLTEPVRVLDLYRQWEGIGFQTDLRGIPIARAPLAKMIKEIDPNGVKTNDEIKAELKSRTQFLTDFLNGHNKRSDQGVLLDSSSYTSLDAPRTPSSILEWSFDLVKGATSGMPEVGQAINREVRDCARIMGAEFLLLGDQGSGSDAMHEDKTAMFGLYANSCLDDIADDAKRDIATRIIALNGLDPDIDTPTCTHEPVMRTAALDACRGLMTMFQAGLNPRDKAINVLRSRMDLPPAPDIDETDLLLPRGTEIETVTPDGRITAVDPNAPKPGLTPTAAAPGQSGNGHARPGVKT